jgi:hypothetical protein
VCSASQKERVAAAAAGSMRGTSTSAVGTGRDGVQQAGGAQFNYVKGVEPTDLCRHVVRRAEIGVRGAKHGALAGPHPDHDVGAFGRRELDPIGRERAGQQPAVGADQRERPAIGEGCSTRR